MIEITAEDAIAGLQQAVNEKGESYIYEPESIGDSNQCVYVDGDRPSCVVGHAFNYLGVSLDIFNEPNVLGENPNVKRIHALKTHLGQCGVVLKDGAATCLDAAQRLQDRGMTWGEALQAAKETLVELGSKP